VKLLIEVRGERKDEDLDKSELVPCLGWEYSYSSKVEYRDFGVVPQQQVRRTKYSTRYF
jgi:hypothetical protein